MTQLGAVACGESPGHPEKSITTEMPSFSASRIVLRLTSRSCCAASLIRVQRIAVRTQGANQSAVIGKNLLKLSES